MKRIIKLLSVFLATIMFFSVFSAANPVFAAELQMADVESSTSHDVYASENEKTSDDEATEKEAEIIAEDLSRRDETTKHFIMSDGTRKAVKYSNPVHFEKDGKWVDIDNTLSYDKERDEYINQENSFKVAFNKNFNSDNLFTIENKGYTLSWEYKTASLLRKSPAAKVEPSIKNEDHYLDRIEKTKSTISYNEFEADSKLEYVVTSMGVKENIIINTPTNKNTFEFSVVAPGLTLEKNVDGSITAKADGDEEIFYIPAPYMFDSVNEYSESVEYELTQSDDDTYTVKVVADKAWLKDKARVYPVTIDPAIQTKKSKSAITATFVASGSPNENFDGRQDVYIGVESSNYLKCRALFEFSLPTLNKGDMVVGAMLALLQYSSSFYTDTMPQQQINAHLVTEDWSASTVKWNSHPSYDTTVLDYSFLKRNVNEWKVFDITKAVKGWYEGTIANNGILIKKEVESGSNSDVAARGIFWSDNSNGVDEYYPYIEVTYRNNKGLEGYWSYSSFSQASCGSASINDYSGNLVYQIPLASTVSEIMPVSLSLVYNTYSSGETYVSGKNGSSKTTPAKGWRFNIQETVLPSSDYGLTGDNAKKYPYVYTDGDGTEHYIQKVTKKDENKNEVVTYEDEDGLGLTVVKDGSEYKITDKMDNVRLFNSQGNLYKIKDANGNSITIKYDDATGKKIEKITDGTGHTLTFGYYENDGTKLDYVETITDNAGRVVEICLSNGKLYAVKYYDGTETHIVYETVGTNLINYVWSNDRVGLNFDYTASSKGYRVRKVTEFAAQTILPSVTGYAKGQVVTFDRTKYNTTVIRSGGIDGITYDTSSTDTTTATQGYKNDDIVTTLQFDNFGRTVSQQVSYGSGGEVGAGAYNYTSTGNTSDSKNKIADAASLGKNTVNMLTNGSCESLTGWTQNSTAGMDTAHYVSTGTPYVGVKSIAIANAKLSNTTGNSNYGQDVTGYTAGKHYTFSAFVKTTNVTPIGLGGLEGAYLQISTIGGSEPKTVYSQVLKGTTQTSINNGWRRISVTVQVPTGTTSLKVYMCLRNANGYAYFDGAQLEESTTPNSVNLLENSSFEAVKSTNAPTYWAMENITNTTNDGASTADLKEGTHSLKINGEANKKKVYFQSIEVQGNPNDTYIVSGWAKADAVNSTFHSHYEKDGEEITNDVASEIFNNTDEEDDETVKLVEDSRFEIGITVWYKDKNGEDVPQDKEPLKFNTNIGDWQYGSTPIVLKYVDDKTTTEDDDKTYTPFKIKISLVYANQANHAYFDHIQLIKDVAQSYVYDKDGNVVSVSANAEQKNNMKYDGEDNLQEYKDAGGNTTKFEYQENTHNLTKVTSPKGVKTEYSYNSVGLNTATETSSSTGSLKIKTTTSHSGEYTSNGHTINAGAYVRYSNDENGYTTTYGYHMPTGTLTSTASPNGLVTSNTYIDNYSKLSKVSAQDTSVKYTYADNRLTNISFGYGPNTTYNEAYSFTYDEFGNVLETKVGSLPLSTNTYIANNGGLSESVYGNNDGVWYNYNYSGNVSAIYHKDNTSTGNTATYGDYPVYTWQYSSNGTPRVHRDGINQIKYDYSYDSIGRLIRTDISDSTNGTAVGSTEYGYNTRGHLTSVSNEIGGKVYNQYYSYSNTGVAGAAENAADGLPTRYTTLGYVTDYSYDDLNRITKRNVDLDNDIQTLYYYKNADLRQGYTTSQISSENLDGTTYAYTYNNMGNISTIKKNNVLYRSYEYDSLGQLTKEIQHDNNKTIDYVYNHLGNISHKTETIANPTTGAPAVKTIKYEYGKDGKDGWNYLLTGYDENNNNKFDENEKISYDNIGNPITYRGASMAWKGRQLTGHTKNGVTSTFSYDADGLRGSKTVGGVKTVYQYVGDKLYYEKRGNSQEFYYFYDSYGKLATIYYGTSTSRAIYHTLTNAQGDVIAIYNHTGALVARYEYDAWGNTLSVKDANGNAITQQNHIANANPIRYRGYYYDADLGLYYLQSRYYDSETGRFINADSQLNEDILGDNLFCYCGNNPIVRYDHGGQFWDYVVDIGFLAWSVVDVVNDPSDWKNWAALAIDIVFAVVPFVPSGAGQVIKVGNKIDDALNVANAINKVSDIQGAAKVTMIGRKMDRVTDVANLLGIADNLYKPWSKYDNAATGLKKVINNGISMAHNGGWLYGKLRKGYTVIDIGVTTTQRGLKGLGLWYGTERFVLGLWETRNIWKLPINYYS